MQAGKPINLEFSITARVHTHQVYALLTGFQNFGYAVSTQIGECDVRPPKASQSRQHRGWINQLSPG